MFYKIYSGRNYGAKWLHLPHSLLFLSILDSFDHASAYFGPLLSLLYQSAMGQNQNKLVKIGLK